MEYNAVQQKNNHDSKLIPSETNSSGLNGLSTNKCNSHPFLF